MLRQRDRIRTSTTGVEFDGLPSHETLQFVDLHSEAQVNEFLSSVEQAIRTLSPPVIREVAASPSDAEALASAVGSRLRSIVGDAPQNWRDLALREEAVEFPNLENLPEVARQRFERWHDWWGSARFATGAVQVRRLHLYDDNLYALQFPKGAAIRNPIRARYDVEDLRTVVEVVIPVLLPDLPGDRPREQAYLGIALWWSSSDARWRPVMSTVYTDGVDVVAPPM